MKDFKKTIYVEMNFLSLQDKYGIIRRAKE